MPKVSSRAYYKMEGIGRSIPLLLSLSVVLSQESTRRMKIDLIIWTLNSERTLDQSLNSIEDAIPTEKTCHKIAVDGGSRDRTLRILKSHDWELHSAPPGIPHQANEALSHVDSEYYASFEHDILLNRNWLPRMERLIHEPRAAVVQGIRIFRGSRVFEAVERYQLETGRFPKWFYSLDNTLYKTRIMREIGGYPRVCPVSTDGVLRQAVLKAGYTWLTDLQCMSYHLRRGYWHQLTHQIRGYMYRRFFDWYGPGTESFLKLLKGVFLSPLSAALIARHQRTPSVFLAYPLYRYVLFHHHLHAYTKRKLRPEIPLPTLRSPDPSVAMWFVAKA